MNDDGEDRDIIDDLLEGSPRTPQEDLQLVLAAAGDVDKDPGAPFEVEVVEALRRLRQVDPASYERGIAALRGKVSMRRLQEAEQLPKPATVGPRAPGGGDWIWTSNNRIMVCEANAARWMVRFGVADQMVYNAMSACMEINRRPMEDADVARLIIRAQQEIIPSGRWDRQAFELAAADLVGTGRITTRHPVKEHIERLDWDGVERINSIVGGILTLGRGDMPDGDYRGYATGVLRAALVSAIARVMQPGCKCDAMLVLIGPQDIGKSTFIEILANNPDWYMADLGGDLHSKDALMSIRGKWVIELAEMFRMSRSDAETAKAFLSRRTDRYRAPFARTVVDVPRQCIFVGSSNRSEIHTDPTGGRRFWPVEVEAIDLDRWRDERDQIMAEAKVLYEAGEPWWLTHGHDKILAASVQDRHSETDIWQERIASFMSRTTGSPTMDDILEALSVTIDKANQSMRTRIGNTMTRLGYTTKQGWEGRIRVRRYIKRDDESP